MADELVHRPFGILPEISPGEIRDNVDKIPASHDYGSINQKDIGITPNQLNRVTMLNCSSAADEDKVGTYASGLSLEG